MDKRCFKQLTARDRFLIAQLKRKKLSLTEIARQIGKSTSTVSRELRRNAVVTTHDEQVVFLEEFGSEEQLDEYLASELPRQASATWRHDEAQGIAEMRAWRAQQKRRRKKPATRKWVVEKLHLGWSPQQIAGRSKLEGEESVSHEYVYGLVHRDKKRGGRLYRLLKRFGKRKQRFGARDYPASTIPSDRVSIDRRPRIVAKRSRIGDYEADLIVGYRQSGYVLSAIDRKSRITSLRKLTSKRMDEVRSQLELSLNELGTARTLTVDNGKEFYGHKQLSKSVGVRVYFTHPYCSSERGSIENLNGLVRYYLPNCSSFARLTQERLNQIAELLNHRPRKCLGYLTPHEVHFKTKSLRTPSRVALDR